MINILLDTNFLLVPAQFKVDIFSEIARICNFRYKLFVIDKTIDELKEIIENQKGKSKDAAGLALQLIEHKKIQRLKTEKNKIVDDLIYDNADKDTIVATNDKYLKRRLLEKHIKVIILRQKKHLVMEG